MYSHPYQIVMRTGPVSHTSEVDHQTKTKQSKESKYWVNQPAITNHFAVLQEEESKEESRKPVIQACQNLTQSM
jgi:endoglucanase Acf2